MSFQSPSVHMQICRHGSHQCRMLKEVQSPERPAHTKSKVRRRVTGLVIITYFMHSCTPFHYLFLRGLWVEDLVQLKDATLSFAQHIQGGLVVGVCRHNHRLALLMLVLFQHGLHATQHTNVTLNRQSGGSVSGRFHFLQSTLLFSVLIPLSSTSCS